MIFQSCRITQLFVTTRSLMLLENNGPVFSRCWCVHIHWSFDFQINWIRKYYLALNEKACVCHSYCTNGSLFLRLLLKIKKRKNLPEYIMETACPFAQLALLCLLSRSFSVGKYIDTLNTVRNVQCFRRQTFSNKLWIVLNFVPRLLIANTPATIRCLNQYRPGSLTHVCITRSWYVIITWLAVHCFSCVHCTQCIVQIQCTRESRRLRSPPPFLVNTVNRYFVIYVAMKCATFYWNNFIWLPLI